MNEATLRFIDEHADCDVRDLALRKVDEQVDLKFALTQIEARQLLAKKVPSWARNRDLVFPDGLPVEQCSSEVTAVYKSDVLKAGAVLTDLTGGLGIDCFFLSKKFDRTHYVEPNAKLCDCAVHNFDVLKAGIKVHNTTAEDFLEEMEHCDTVYLDPSRRDVNGRKTVSIVDCTPDVTALRNKLFEKTETVLVKLSPMLDIKQAMTELENVREVHVVSVGNECKELLFLLQKDFFGTAGIICANKPNNQSFRMFASDYTKEQDCSVGFAYAPDRYLYEPDSSILKAGLFKTVGARYGMKKLHPNSHLYTSDKLVEGFCGRAFEVEASMEFGKGAGRMLHGIKKANITTRNFPLSADRLRKQLGMADGGDVFMFATTLYPNKRVIIKTKRI